MEFHKYQNLIKIPDWFLIFRLQKHESGWRTSIKSDSFPVTEPLCSTYCEIQKRSVLPVKATFMAAHHHHMKASQHAHRSTHQAALHPSLCVWPKFPGHAALHALVSVHPSYDLDFTQCDFCVYISKKEFLKDRGFTCSKDVYATVMQWFQQEHVELFWRGPISWYVNPL
jgi:hypothetical protein